jgi:hypothetical protein
MAINRSLMERQLRMGGGIMGLEPRQQYGLGSFVKKAVKGVTGAVKSIAKSDIGKAALLYAGTAGLGSLGAGGGFGSLFKLGTYAPSSVFSNVGSTLFGKTIMGGNAAKGAGYFKPGLFKTAADAITGNAGMIGASVLGGVLGSMTPQEQEEISGSGGTNVEALRSKLTQAYRNLAYDEAEIPTLVANDLSEYTSGQGGYAEGGRIGYADGSEDMVLPMRKPEIEEMIFSNPGAAESGNPISRNNPVANLIDKYNTYKKAMPGVADETKTYLIEDFKKSLEDSGISIEEFNMRLQEQNEMDEPVDMAYGGRIGYAFGTPEQNAIQAAGIEGLPLNQNPAGVTELDLRETGGFIPPVGVKEKADDIPAMLANNEFVFTADAVRGMGEGNVNKGAQRMYDMMKKLEKGGRV